MKELEKKIRWAMEVLDPKNITPGPEEKEKAYQVIVAALTLILE
jgi:hypothetical protein